MYTESAVIEEGMGTHSYYKGVLIGIGVVITNRGAVLILRTRHLSEGGLYKLKLSY